MSGYARQMIKREAKGRLSERYPFFFGITASWMLMSLFFARLTGNFLPQFPSDLAGLDALLEDPWAPYLQMTAQQITGWLLALALVYILRTPFLTGISSIYLLHARSEAVAAKQLAAFYIGPGLWSRSLLTELLRAFREILCMLPGLACVALPMIFPGMPDGPALLLILAGLSLTVWGLVAMGAYAQTRYLLANNPDLRPGEAVALSAQIMKGRLVEFALFRASFLPWYVLMAATAMLAALYFIPYFEMCMSLYVKRTWRSDKLAPPAGEHPARCDGSPPQE